jgi:hypothetical protein
LRILKENIQMYSQNSFKSLALSSSDVFMQVGYTWNRVNLLSRYRCSGMLLLT